MRSLLLLILSALAAGALAQTSHPTVGPNAPYPLQVPCMTGVPVTAPADTAENVMFTCTSAAGALGLNGTLRVTVNYTMVGAGNKTLRMRYGGVAGTQWGSGSTNATRATATYYITNNNSASAQQISMVLLTTSAGNNVSLTTAAANTAVQGDIVATCTKATGSDTCTLESITIERAYKP